MRFPARPIVTEDLLVFRMPDGLGFQFHGGASPVAFRGSEATTVLDYLLPLLDGSHKTSQLVEQRPQSVSASTILRTLKLLHTKGILVEASQSRHLGSDETLKRQLLFWGRKLALTGAAPSAAVAQQQLTDARIALVATGLFGIATYDGLVRAGCADVAVLAWDDPGSLLKALRESAHPPRREVRLATTSTERATSSLRELATSADLVVTATRHAPAELFRTINRLCLEEEVPFLLANENDPVYEIGPYVQPYRSACYSCLELRRASVHDHMLEDHLYQEYLAKERRAGQSSLVGESVATATLASSLVSLEVTRILTGLAQPTLLNGVQSVSPLTNSFEINRVLRAPRCPSCRPGTIPRCPQE